MANISNQLVDTLKLDRPEDALLLCCARTDIESDTTERMQTLLRESMDWDYLIRAASTQGVKPLLCSALSKNCPKSVPRPVLEQLQRYLHAHALRNFFLTRELLKILHTLEKNRISAIPYKGPVLAAAAYGDVALRQFGDLDILVREQDAMRAKDLLISLGYRPLYEQPVEQEAAFYGLRKVYELVRKDGQVVVELHWAITSRTFPFALDPASLWERADMVSLEGRSVLNLALEDLLLVLSVHGAKHHWGKLMWICDIAEVIRSYAEKVDWSQLMTRARSLGATRMIALALFLARDLLGAAVPEDVWRRVKAEPRVAWLAGQVKRELFSGGALMAVERPAFYIQLRERLQDRFRCRLYLAYRSMAPQAQAWALRFAHKGSPARHFWRRPK